jgi:hypothetical protein
MMRFPCAALWVAATLSPVWAKEPASVDKSQYHLFNPTQRQDMREMSTDRPDVTESAYTVDAGHVQMEMDLASFTRDRHTPERDGGEDSWSFLNTNLKIGLTNWADLQLVVPVFTRVRGGSEGFGDLTLRLKMNLWGNDGGTTALAVMPFVKLPTASDGLGNDEWEGGLIVPFAAELPGGWGFGAMAEVDIVAADEGGGHHPEFVTSITFSHDITEKLGGYVEFVSVLSEEKDWAASFDCGLTYGLTENIQLDAGVNIGLTRAADDLNPFVGLSVRF